MLLSTKGRKSIVAQRINTPVITFGTITTTSVVINWTNETGRTNTILERSTAADFSLNLTSVYTGGNLTFTDTGLSSSTTYYYRVKESGIGYIDSFYGTNNTTTSGGGAGQLNTPTLNRLGYGLNSISLTWPAVTSATGYVLQRATDSGFTTGLTTLYSGLASGVTRQYQPGLTLEYHDSGLTTNTNYWYRVKATDSTATYTDSAYSTKATATGASNKTATYNTPNIFAACSEGAFDYWNGSAIVKVHGGDTVVLNGTTLTYWSLQGFHGTPTEPLIMRNQGDVEMSNGISLESCSYITALFNHSSKTLSKGLSVYGHHGGAAVNIFGLSHHIEVGHILTRGTAYSIWCKNELVTFSADADCGAQYWYPSRITDIKIHDIDAADHFQDCFYIGSSGEWAGSRNITCGGSTISPRPSASANIEIYNNTMTRIARSGLQMGGMDMGTNKVYGNTITECGWEFVDNQGAGIAIGGSAGDLEVYSNTVSRTFLHSVYSYSHGLFYYHNNTTSDTTKTVDPSNPYSYMEIALTGGQTISSVWNGQSGKRIIDNLGEYMFEYFFANAANSNPQLKLQRLVDTLSASKITIPTTHPTTVTFAVRDTGRAFAAGQTVRAFAPNQSGNVWIEGTITSYSGGNLVISSTANSGTGQFRLWNIYKHSRTPQAALQAISTTSPGSHAGTTGDPYVGFGASSTITSSQVTFMSEVWIPAAFAQSNLMLNAFSNNPVTVYGSPEGLKRFRIENNSFGIQRAGSTAVIVFNNTTNNYDTDYGNIICGNTYLSSALTNSNITKPAGSVVTYSISSSCVPTSTLVGTQKTFNTTSGSAPGGYKWLPSDYSDPANATKTYPTIIFLHGSGEAASPRNDTLLKSTSLPEVITLGQWNGIAKDPDTNIYYQFLVFAPQAPGWSYSGADVAAIYSDIVANFRVDPNRVYITGLSAGGSGTISIGENATLRTNIAAIVPIASAGFNTTSQDTNFDLIPANGIELLGIVGNDDSRKTEMTTYINRYNADSHTVDAKLRIIVSPAGHDENTWNTCFQTTFDVNNGVGTAMNVYEWMLKYHK